MEQRYPKEIDEFLEQKPTICDKFQEAEKMWFPPERLERDELESLAYGLYSVIEEMYSMGLAMTEKLREYKRIFADLKGGK